MLKFLKINLRDRQLCDINGCKAYVNFIFEKTIEYKETKEDERNRLRLTAIISHIEALQYTRLIKENDLQKTIRIFATSINDYFDGGINDEDFIGFYKNT
ncbi:hypothetical protein OX499_000974, partial [Campylobacter coli]|nr:hypothetical protein [Campylobacter coli]